jgi:hypothetical protein
MTNRQKHKQNALSILLSNKHIQYNTLPSPAIPTKKKRVLSGHNITITVSFDKLV